MKRALIIKIGAIGDAIMALPIVTALKSEGYESITWLAGAEIVPVLKLVPEIDKIVVLNQRALFGSPFRAVIEVLKSWWNLKFVRPTHVYVLHGDGRYSLLIPFWLRWIERSCVRPKTRRHHTFEYARLAVPSIEDNQLGFSPYILSTEGPSNRLEKNICLFPGGAKNALRDDPLRRWPTENYVELAENLIAAGYKITIAGGPSDDWVEPYFDRIKSKVNFVIGKLRLEETVALLQKEALVISHDTGPVHLASLADCPIISIFGPTMPASFAPIRYQNLAVSLEPKLPCQPCYDGKEYGNCTNNLCLQQLKVSTVTAKALAFLRG